MERWFLQKDAWEEPVKLPRISYFRGTRIESSPYDRLYQWLLNKLFPMSSLLYGNKQERAIYLTEKGFSVTNVWLHHEDATKFKNMVMDWAVRTHKISKKRLGRSIAFYDLDYGPGEFRLDQDYQLPKWVKPGYVYMRKINHE